MRQSIFALIILAITPFIYASDMITGPQARKLFQLSFQNGGDIYCSANSCVLDTQCIYNKFDQEDKRFSCNMNNDFDLSVSQSEVLFRGIFNSALTMDAKCSAHYCELSSRCSYSRLEGYSSEYICEIY